MSSRKPYSGTSRKIVLAFDVGTTFSAISYSVLDPGLVPEIKRVTRFPAQEQVVWSSKIPSIIYYDQAGDVRAVGDEASQGSVVEKAKAENWVKVEWFKLHLRPKTMEIPERIDMLPLPENKTAVSVFADFLRYLQNCAKIYIQDAHMNGRDLWESVEHRLEFVLTHPNGWEGAQQSQMRRAAVLAGLIPDNVGGQSRLQFVTEGEASLHFCIGTGVIAEVMKAGNGVIIVDAGGGTVDVSSYGMTSSATGYSFQEIAPSQCHFEGSSFVTRSARQFIADHLRNSRFLQRIDDITNCFDTKTKPGFRNSNAPYYIKFGSVRDNEPAVNIRSGQLKLPGEEIAKFFVPAVRYIIEAIVKQRSDANKPISAILLVGGFAGSEWLFSKLRTYLQPLCVELCRPDSHGNKVVPDGAVSFYLDRFVSVRVAKFTYGSPCCRQFDDSDPEHLSRKHLLFSRPSGRKVVQKGFVPIITKGTQVSETQEFRQSFVREVQRLFDLGPISDAITCFRGSKNPLWTDEEPDMFSTLCNVNADASQIPPTPRLGKQGIYFLLKYDIVLSFGLTELKAQLSWTVNGEEERSPATIVYDEDIDASDA